MRRRNETASDRNGYDVQMPSPSPFLTAATNSVAETTATATIAASGQKFIVSPSPIAMAAASAASSAKWQNYYHRDSPQTPSKEEDDDGDDKRFLLSSPFPSSPHSPAWSCSSSLHSKPRIPSSASSPSLTSSSVSNPLTSPQAFFLLLVSLSAILIPSCRYRSLSSELFAIHSKLAFEGSRLDSMKAELESASRRAKELDEEHLVVRKRKAALALAIHDELQRHGGRKKSIDESESDEIERESDQMHKNIKSLRMDTANLVQTHLIRKYGQAPPLVRFDVRFLGSNGRPTDDPTDQASFVVQLSSVATHTVDEGGASAIAAVGHFLRAAIELNLWDGAAFVHHVEDRITAVPTEYRTAKSTRARFEEKIGEEGLKTLYAEGEDIIGEQPRTPGSSHYALSYSGSDGMEFHVHMEDSNIAPTFGVVIKGRNVVDRIAQRNIPMDSRSRRKINVVGIERVVLLESKGDGDIASLEEETNNVGKSGSSSIKVEWSARSMSVEGDGSTANDL